jgi:hypothetical protein
MRTSVTFGSGTGAFEREDRACGVRKRHGEMVMSHTQLAEISSRQVSALFAGGEISFSLPKDATFADLADSFDQLGDRDLGRALAIYLRFNAADRPVSALCSGIQPIHRVHR